MFYIITLTSSDKVMYFGINHQGDAYWSPYIENVDIFHNIESAETWVELSPFFKNLPVDKGMVTILQMESKLVKKYAFDKEISGSVFE